MELLEQKIKGLRALRPDDGYAQKSRGLILSSPMSNISKYRNIKISKYNFITHLFESLRYSAALGLGVIMLIVALGGFSYLRHNSSSSVLGSGLNANSLSTEAGLAEESVQLAEARYFESADSVVAVALAKISGNDPDHLDQDILERELKGLEPDAKNPRTIESLLNETIL